MSTVVLLRMYLLWDGSLSGRVERGAVTRLKPLGCWRAAQISYFKAWLSCVPVVLLLVYILFQILTEL